LPAGIDTISYSHLNYIYRQVVSCGFIRLWFALEATVKHITAVDTIFLTFCFWQSLRGVFHEMTETCFRRFPKCAFYIKPDMMLEMRRIN